jgi:hypothetical protein
MSCFACLAARRSRADLRDCRAAAAAVVLRPLLLLWLLLLNLSRGSLFLSSGRGGVSDDRVPPNQLLCALLVPCLMLLPLCCVLTCSLDRTVDYNNKSVVSL